MAIANSRAPVQGKFDGARRLELQGLTVGFPGAQGYTTVVHDLDMQVAPGERIAIVGESGSGKSVSMMALLGLLQPNARISGRLRYAGRDVDISSQRALRPLRGSEIGMVFQDPMSSLNPTMTVGRQMVQALVKHRGVGRRQALDRAEQLLEQVGIRNPRERLTQYPHEFSGGMRQRIMIAAALMPEPAMLIADEPTTALDVTVQRQILLLLRSLSENLGLSIVLITHDLAVVANFAQRAYVMYAGRVVEERDLEGMLNTPRHPYTSGLLSCVPRLDRPRDEPLHPIPGRPIRPDEVTAGACSFAPRCPHAMEHCREEQPKLVRVGDGAVSCWLNGATGLAPAGLDR
ncbi:MAG TPA: ABC transporter ATP-binding protein [Jatrophihabitans sp.]|jgi:oligopeptide/dipeptide ABC transporter ATP-binding protein